MPTPARFVALGLGCACAVALGSSTFSAAQPPLRTPSASQSQAPPQAVTQTVSSASTRPEVGIPVGDDTVRKACGTCHPSDDKQQMSRISFRRTTPEGWERTITRMMTLNGLKIDAQTARQVVKYLSNAHGLAPEEARATMYEVERRQVDEPYKAKELNGTCDACHALGRVLYQRRTRQEWELVIAMHRGYYPIIDRQTYRRLGPTPRDRDAEGRLPDTRHPSERAIDHLVQAFPLETKEWAAWSASMRPARIDGSWALSGWEPGKGSVFGRLTLTHVTGSTDEFNSQITYTYTRSGQQVSRTGRVTIYTGFQWRGRSTSGGNDATALREVMFVEPDWSKIEGRWFTGGYDEMGLDVRLTRIGRDLSLAGVDRTALRVGTTGQPLKIYAANAPATLAPRDIDLGTGVTVTGVTVAGDVITATVDVASTATIGPRTLAIGVVTLPSAVTLFDQIDAIRVAPQWSMARTGGVIFPKQLSAFDAWAYHNGADKKPNTSDDLRLDAVPATWSLEEYKATFDDEDIRFVGAIDEATGLFTPNIEGPNPQRKGERNNIGDVWVVANYTPPGAKTALRARAHLLVAPPLYIKFDPTVTP